MFLCLFALILAHTHKCSLAVPPPSRTCTTIIFHLLPELLDALLPDFVIFLAYRHVQESVSFCFGMEEAVPEFQQVSFPVAALPAVPMSSPISLVD